MLPVPSQNIAGRKVTPSSVKWMKKNSNMSANLQDTSWDSKIKCRNTGSNYHCMFPQDTFSMKRPTTFCPLEFTGLESFSPTEACVTCQLSCRCDLFWNEETRGVFSLLPHVWLNL